MLNIAELTLVDGHGETHVMLDLVHGDHIVVRHARAKDHLWNSRTLVRDTEAYDRAVSRAMHGAAFVADTE